VEHGKQVLQPVIRLSKKQQALMLLRLLLIGDVHHDTKANRLATFIVPALTQGLDPTDRPVLLAQPVLVLRWRRYDNRLCV
jgi:hypothetical protein